MGSSLPLLSPSKTNGFAPVSDVITHDGQSEIRFKRGMQVDRDSPTTSAPRAAEGPRAKRNCGPVIAGGIVPPGTLAPNTCHPLRHVPPHRRAELALETLGHLVLRVAQTPLSSSGSGTTGNHDEPLNGERASSTATNDKE
jgi:hypothetical protein